MKSICKRAGALLLALLLCLSLVPAAAAAGTVTIRTLDEFLRFADACANDSYSVGLTVELETDLDLSGSGFTSIPVFCGVFHGNGHTITHYRVEKKGSQMGFFRHLEEGASVSGLKIEEGALLPDGSRSELGLLAGVNRGLIENCTVSGEVDGEEQVGGLVGVNEESGVIRNCTNGAVITGLRDAGGVAGRNDGTIERCINQGEVNRVREGDAACNTGGIAGSSSGLIQFCENHADLGYDHKGYNTGGIAGLQNGAVVSCVNTGAISGRKDVGGIVGQFEPQLTVASGSDPRDRLDQAMAALTERMRTFAGQTYSASQEAVADMEVINSAMDAIRARGNTSVKDMLADTDAVVQTVHTATDTIQTALTVLLDQTDGYRADAGKRLDEIEDAVTELRGAVDDLAGHADDGLSDAFDTMDEELSELERQMKQVTKGMDGLSEDMKAVQDFLKTSDAVLEEVRELLEQLGSGNAEDILQQLDELMNELSNALSHVKHIDPAGHLAQVSAGIEGATGALSDLVSDLNDLYEDTSEEMRKDWDRADNALDGLRDAVDGLRVRSKTFADAVSGELRTLTDQLNVITQALNSYWNTVHDKGSSAVDDIDAQLQIIQKQMDKISQGASETSSDLYSTTLSILDQLDQVRSALMDLMDLPECSLEDISDGHVDEGNGRVSACRNSAAVNADCNAGGIVGNISMEVTSDPEKEWDLNDPDHPLLADAALCVLAVIRDSRNEGDITAKKSVAGGILGSGMVGAVLNCVSRGRVEADDEGQAGGIAGLSRSVIRGCAAQADLSGGDHLGGIVGQGRDIYDCVAMTRIDSQGEKLGAIAGSADSRSFLEEANAALDGEADNGTEEDGVVQNNRFLQEALAGVDGVTYSGQTEGLSYEAFSALENVPAEFLDLAVTFVSNGETVKTIPVEYGGRVEESEFPAVPVWNGYYGRWETFETGGITRSVTVHAVYDNWSTTISSGGQRPVLLAEGSFSPSARLTAEPWTPEEDTGEELTGYSYRVEDPDAALPDTVTLRVRAENEGDRVYLNRDGVLTEMTDARRDGSYLVFSAPLSGVVAVRPEAEMSVLLLVGIAAGVAVLLALLVFLLIRRRRSRPRKGATVREKELREERKAAASAGIGQDE